MEFLVMIWQTIKNNLTEMISLIAILLSLYSFWWMSWRKGRLIVGIPNTYAAISAAPNDLLLVQLPLFLFNDGATAQVVQDLRIKLRSNGLESSYLEWNTSQNALVNEEGKKWAMQFGVLGRSSYQSVFVFLCKHGKFSFSKGVTDVTLEGKINNRDKWKKLLQFSIIIKEENVNTLNSRTILVYEK